MDDYICESCLLSYHSRSADPAAFEPTAEGLADSVAVSANAPAAARMSPACMVGGLPAPATALRSGLRAAGLRASSVSAWAEEAPALGMIPTGTAEAAVSPPSQPGTVPQKKRRAADSASESEPPSLSSSEELLSSDEDEVMPSSKRAKRGPAAPELRRTTRAAARGAADGGTGDVAAAKGKHAADQKRAGRKPTAERVVAGSDSEKDEPARPAPSKGTRRRVAFAEHAAEADEGAGAPGGVVLPPPPPAPTVKQVVTAAGALRAKEAVLEVCSFSEATVRGCHASYSLQQKC